MGIAWLLSVMLVKFYDNTLPLFTSPAFSRSVHNKAIQKAIDIRIVSKNSILKHLKSDGAFTGRRRKGIHAADI